jgi:O-antigen ligase
MKLSLRALFSKSLKFAALFIITQDIINTRAKLENFLKIALISCGIIIIDGFIQYYILHYDLLHLYPSFGYRAFSMGAPTASFPFPNDYAAWIIMFIFPIGLYAFFAKSVVSKKIISWSVAAGLFYSLMLTRVRGALLAFFISFGLLALTKLKKIGLFLLVILLLTGLFINKSHIPGILSMNSITDRGVIWNNGWEIFKRHPVIGNGLNTFYVEYMNIRDDKYKGTHGSYAHNCYLQMATDIGIVGLLTFILFIGAVLIKGFKSARGTKDPLYYSIIMGLSLGLVAFLIHSSVDTNLYSLNLSALFWISAGLLMSVIKISAQR